MEKRTVKVPIMGLLPYKQISIDKCKFIYLSRYMNMEYGIPVRTMYYKLRERRIKKWEWMGIENCIRDFMPGYTGELADFWDAVPGRWKFIDYMSEHGMSAMTVYRHFAGFNFKEWELIGLSRIVDDWRKSEGA